MMYPFMTLENGTEIVHSELRLVNGAEQVKVYLEQPVEGGFHSAECYLPGYEWKQIDGFTQQEIDTYQEFLESTAHIIIRLAREGGFDCAAILEARNQDIIRKWISFFGEIRYYC